MSMRLTLWQTLAPEAVVQLACHLYRHIGGADLSEHPRGDAWRDESLLNLSAVYTVAHGFTLGERGEGLTFQTQENWEKHATGSQLVGATVRARSVGQHQLQVDYRHGQLHCDLPPGAIDEAQLGDLVRKVTGSI